MTPDDFRRVFNRVREPDLMWLEPHGGGPAGIVLGLNGDHAVLHGGREIPLANLREHPVNENWLQEREEAR
jgi:hypothetical protein